MQNKGTESLLPSGKRWSWRYFVVGFGSTLSGVVVICLAWTMMYCYGPVERSYTKITELASPNGSKIALVFRQDAVGTDAEQAVRIVSKGELFAPHGSSNRAQPQKGLPQFEFSIARRDGVQLRWKDNSNLAISYPLSEKLTPTYQRPRGYSTDVRIDYSPLNITR
jgi:hypothetical protein